MSAQFWIKRTPPGTFTIGDLGLIVSGSGFEIDLLTMFDTERLANSSDLVAALGADSVTRLRGPGGLEIVAADAFNDIQPQLQLTWDAGDYLDGTGNFSKPAGTGPGTRDELYDSEPGIPRVTTIDNGDEVKKIVDGNAYEWNNGSSGQLEKIEDGDCELPGKDKWITNDLASKTSEDAYEGTQSFLLEKVFAEWGVIEQEIVVPIDTVVRRSFWAKRRVPGIAASIEVGTCGHFVSEIPITDDWVEYTETIVAQNELGNNFLLIGLVNSSAGDVLIDLISVLHLPTAAATFADADCEDPDMDDWFITGAVKSTEQAHGGVRSIKLPIEGDAVSQDIMEIGKNYLVRFWGRGTVSEAFEDVQIFDEITYVTTVQFTNGWEQRTVFLENVTSQTIRFRYDTEGTNGVWLDDFSFVEVPAIAAKTIRFQNGEGGFGMAADVDYILETVTGEHILGAYGKQYSVSQGADLDTVSQAVVEAINEVNGYSLTHVTEHTPDGSDEGVHPLHGFRNRTTSSMAMSGTSLQITPIGSYDVFVNGLKITKSGMVAVPITADLASTFITINAAGTFTPSLTPFDVTDLTQTPVALVYRDGTGYQVWDERHWMLRNLAAHSYNHTTIGARYLGSGLTGTFTNTTLSITQGRYMDDEPGMIHDTGGTKTTAYLWYRNGAATAMRFEALQAFPYKQVAGDLKYDNNGTLTDVDVSKFVNSWVYASPGDGLNTAQISIVVGQAQYSTALAASFDPAPSIPGMSVLELKLLYRVVYRNVGGVATYEAAQDLRNVQSGPAGSPVPTDHSGLTGRDAANSHPITAIGADPNMLFYSDNSGVIQQLPLGANGTYVKSNGETAAPSFATPAGGSGSSSFYFGADTLDISYSADLPITVPAEPTMDTNNASLPVLRFDQTTVEGCHFKVLPPAGMTNIIFEFQSRAEAAPGAIRTVGLGIYRRGLPDNLVVPAWSAVGTLSDLSMPASNEFWQYDSETVTLASLGITAGQKTHLQLVRKAPQAGINLTGDWTLLDLNVRFS